MANLNVVGALANLRLMLILAGYVEYRSYTTVNIQHSRPGKCHDECRLGRQFLWLLSRVINGSVAESMGEPGPTPALQRLLPFAFHGDSMEGRGGVKGSLRRAKTARP